MIDIVFPCLNEALSMPDLLSRIPDGFRAVVADNGSTDGSPDIARDLGATVIDVPQRGFGAAAHAGLLACSSDVVCFCDADGTLDPRQLPRVVGPVVEGRADLVLGRRRSAARGAFPVHARAGNAVLARHLRRRSGVDIRDLGPMRAGRRETLLQLKIADRRFGYPLEMVLKGAAAQWRIEEVDVDYYPRPPGSRSKVTGSVRGTLRAVRDMRAVLAQ
ncbi:MAG TPA: glycosyltransferase family 2 protein [Mycobacteriales bacterium]|jgi:glycosyltransferase involved in cell wall biosynthesis|nr:glycosyltransferase family 2 protein [Mycobacteriales bacterium]